MKVARLVGVWVLALALAVVAVALVWVTWVDPWPTAPAVSENQWMATAAIAAAVAAAIAAWTACQNRAAIREAKRAADAAERSTLLQSVPIAFGWWAAGFGKSTSVTLTAIGAGVAFNISAEVSQDDKSLGRTPVLSHLEPGDTPHLDLQPSYGGLDEKRLHQVETTYSDAAGTKYRTIRDSLTEGAGHLTSFDRWVDGKWRPLLQFEQSQQAVTKANAHP